jgi:hypothetical protein
MVVTEPDGTEDILFNPGMGFAFCQFAAPREWLEGESYWASAISDHVYIRVAWKDLNPARGVYTIDESKLGRWVKALKTAGRRFSLRIMPSVPGWNTEDGAPPWIYETGVKCVVLEPSGSRGRLTLAVGLVTRQGRPLDLALKERRPDHLCPWRPSTAQRNDASIPLRGMARSSYPFRLSTAIEPHGTLL